MKLEKKDLIVKKDHSSPDTRQSDEARFNAGRRKALMMMGALSSAPLLAACGSGDQTGANASGNASAAALPAAPAQAAAQPQTYYVSVTTGTLTGTGTEASPFQSIGAAAAIAQPGDTVVVHGGVYRERVKPVNGGTSDTARITYQAVPGETPIVTGSNPVTGWTKVSNDTWKVVIPSKNFGNFNPYIDLVRGDWYTPSTTNYHTGCVYLNDVALQEAAQLSQVQAAAGATPLWFAQVDSNAGATDWLLNIASLQPTGGTKIDASIPSGRYNGQSAVGTDGIACSGFITTDSLLRFDQVNFGTNCSTIDLRLSTNNRDVTVEIRLDDLEGQLLGTCTANTAGWTTWKTYTVSITPMSGTHTICLVFKNPAIATGNTTIYAQFPGVANPNLGQVEINTRQTVFYPEKTGINYITVNGFTLKNAACNWAAPTAEQRAIIGTNWSEGWVIESNTIYNAKCCGISLGKYGDGYGNTYSPPTTPEYTDCVNRALLNGWTQGTVGGHLVKNNHVYNCGQTGIVGSMGCAFSIVEGNDVHDIDYANLFAGAEMAGIKFHGAIDVIIRNNHIYRCGGVSGIWLDWMGQGARISANLMHDNTRDVFLEMQHGPILVDNNILLSPQVWLNSSSIAFVHNLIAVSMFITNYDGRVTPYHTAHSTAIAGSHDSPSGDYRFYNNLITSPCDLSSVNSAKMASTASGNVFTKGATASSYDTNSVKASTYDPTVSLTEMDDGWYLTIQESSAWKTQAPRSLITTAILGTSSISGEKFENPDATALSISTDFLGVTRDLTNPFPGPFEIPINESVKVWSLGS
jgi:alpha-L-arabinofuranosidase